MIRIALSAGLVWLAVLGAGCELAGWPRRAGDAGEVGAQARGRVSPPAREQNDPAHELARLTREGHFQQAHNLAAEQAAAAAMADDAVMALWWRCQDLHVYLWEDQLAARGELAGRLAVEPAARDRRFCLSSGWRELFAALTQAGLRTQAQRLLYDRYRAVMVIRPRTLWWQHQMAEIAGEAHKLGDAELARTAAAEVDLPAADPYRSLLSPSTQPAAVIQPSPIGPRR